MIPITEIGETDPSTLPTQNNGLQCITDRIPCCRATQSGKWFFPNRTVVPDQENAISFYINRGLDDGTVNLNRVNDSMMPMGIFCCTIPDAKGVTNYICIKLIGIEGELVSFN